METRGPGVGPLIQLESKSLLDNDIRDLGIESNFSFFKQPYSQYNTFNMQYHTSDLFYHPYGKTLLFDIPKQSHLVKSINLFINIYKLTSDVHWTNGVLFSMIKQIRLRCDNSLFYNIPFEYIFVKNSLQTSKSKKTCLDMLNGCFNVESSLYEFSQQNNVLYLQIPLFDYFPLLSIKNNNLRLEIDFNTLNNLICACSDNQYKIHCILNVSDDDVIRTQLQSEISVQSRNQINYFGYQFNIDYIELNEAEHTLFINKELKYTIEQMNYKQIKTKYNTLLHIDLDDFINPTTQLIFTFELLNNIQYNKRIKYQTINEISLVLNGIKRKDRVNARLFKNHHRNLNYTKNIYSIGFALDSNNIRQPNGTYNFSTSSNNYLELFLDSSFNNENIIVNVYGPYYNFINIKDGNFKLEFI